MRNLFLAILVALFTLVATPARAAYQYTYTSNVFNVTQQIGNGGEYTFSYDSEGYITIDVLSQTALTAGAALTPDLAFSMTYYGPGFTRTVYSSYPGADPSAPGGSINNPYNNASFSIVSVDGAGLPAIWDISVELTMYPVGGRAYTNFIHSSNAEDSVFGGYQGFSEYSGAGSDQRGVWTMAVVVPEPQTYAMLLAGLLLIAYTARRRLRTRI
jgi:hypothetical protein